MIKIARLIPFFTGQYGGPVNHIIELTRSLKQYPVNTTIYTTTSIDHTSKRKTLPYQEINPNFKIKRFNSYLRLKEYRISYGLPLSLLKDAQKIDIFHSHALRSFQEDIATLIAKFKKKKFVITPHGALCTNLTYFQHLYKRLYDLTFSTLKNRYLEIEYIAVAKVEIDFLKRFGIPTEKIHYIPHGINTSFFKPLDSYEFRKRYNLLNKKIILYVGRLSKRKGIDIVIKMFNNLKDNIDDSYLLIAGGDFGYKSELEKLVKKLNLQNRILFLGFIPKKFLPWVYNAANIVVYPSKFEIFGHVILEANACGKVVIASNHWGPKELILNGKNGFLIKYGDINALKEKVEKLLTEEELQKKMGNFARDYVKKNYSWERSARDHFALYKKLIE